MTSDKRPTKMPSGRLAAFLAAFVVLLFCPVPDGMRPEAMRLIAVTFLMAALWVSQVIPLAATSLLPLALFPLLGIQNAKTVSAAFINDNVFLFLGGFFIALSIERWGLHRRIALRIVAAIGSQPKRLVLGFIVATGGLSMWISNTATTLMMLPIALALLQTLEQESGEEGKALATRLAVPILLGIAYSASVGGMTTIVGTPTNTVAASIYAESTTPPPENESSQSRADDSADSTDGRTQIKPATDATVSREISVAQWMLACMPIGVLYLLMIWLVLTWRLPRATEHDEGLRTVLRERLNQLGRMTFAERRVLILFVLTALLWLFRRPLDIGSYRLIPGWSQLIPAWFGQLGVSDSIDPAGFINDSTVAILVAVLLFFIPSGTKTEDGKSVPLMNWETAVKLPWDIVLLFGGGFALAKAYGVTGLAEWLGGELEGLLTGQPAWIIVAGVCLVMIFLTEVTSNVATVNTLLPTLITMSVALGLNPLMMMVPATLATSCAFMLPIATPPNAIVFGSGRIQVQDMVRYGFLLNLIGVPLLTVATWLLIRPVFGI
ncbi:MAG TPA: anion transporter [Planctomycetaceae bacterium]|nr:anion transporter [Planctomycetaceae bacterium]